MQERKRVVTLHVSNKQGDRLEGALVEVQQISKDFPLGSAIADTILGNLPYQVVYIIECINNIRLILLFH